MTETVDDYEQIQSAIDETKFSEEEITARATLALVENSVWIDTNPMLNLCSSKVLAL